MASASQAPSEGTVAAAEPSPRAPLVRAVGQEYVHQQLSAKPPVNAIRAIKQHASLPDPRCKPLLGLLDQLGAPRMDTHRAVLEAAKRKLSDLMKKLGPDALQLLLQYSFPYIGVPELRDIPLAVLGQLQPVPPDFLRQLSTDKELFADLPTSVQIQVFELDRKLLQAHAMPYIAAYTWEKGTLMRALDMDEFLPPRTGGVPEEELRLRSRRLPRRQQRKMSPALKKLVAMVGGSFTIYKGIVDLCVAKYRDSEGLYVGLKETAYCSLRSQLLMALHDAGANELCSKEPCHKLAWILDACSKDQSLDDRRLKELSAFFSSFQRAGHQKSHKRPRTWDENGSRPKSDSHSEERVLAEAGMVLREPCTLHLIIHQVLRKLEALAESEASASGDGDLIFMTCLMQLAVGARKMLREKRYQFPEVSSDLLKTFYPILSSFILEVQLREPNETDDEGSEEIDGSLVALLQKDEIVRKVTQIFCLERLASGDTITARTLLANIVAALHKLSDRGVMEWAAFAATLAQRLARMLAAGLISPAHQIWNLAVDKILIQSVDADIQVHEEVLRLLLAASQQLSVPQLAQYLQNSINNSKRSRRKFKRRHMETAPIGSYTGYSSGGTSGNNSSGFSSSFMPDGALSDGGVGGPPSKKVSDGIKSVYQEFPKQVPELNEDNAPVLYQYLNDVL